MLVLQGRKTSCKTPIVLPDTQVSQFSPSAWCMSLPLSMRASSSQPHYTVLHLSSSGCFLQYKKSTSSKPQSSSPQFRLVWAVRDPLLGSRPTSSGVSHQVQPLSLLDLCCLLNKQDIPPQHPHSPREASRDGQGQARRGHADAQSPGKLEILQLQNKILLLEGVMGCLFMSDAPCIPHGKARQKWSWSMQRAASAYGHAPGPSHTC